MLSSVLRRNARTPRAFALLNAQGRYHDGMSLYQFVGSNPIRYHDPNGQALLLNQTSTAAIAATVATVGVGIFATSGLANQIANLMGSVLGYQTTTSIFAYNVDAGLAFGRAAGSVLAAQAVLAVRSQTSALRAAAVATVRLGFRPVESGREPGLTRVRYRGRCGSAEHGRSARSSES